MTLPHDDTVQLELLRLLASANEGRMCCADVYGALEQRFGGLKRDETAFAYRASRSHFANRVQWARQHAIERGWLLPAQSIGERGVWAVSAAGRERLRFLGALAEEMMGELNA